MLRHEADSIFGMNTKGMFIYENAHLNFASGSQVWLAGGYVLTNIAIPNTTSVNIVEHSLFDAAKAKQDKIAEINANYEEVIGELVKETPGHERESWFKQEIEAKSFSVDASSKTPYIDILANSRGIPREILLMKVLEKVSHYESAHARLTGIRQAKEDEVKALSEDCTLEDINAIKWELK